MTTREQLLESAFVAFLENGFNGVSLNDVIKRSGMTKGGFYHHFSSKDDLLSEVISTYFHSYIGQNIKEFSEMSGTIETRLKFVVTSMVGIQSSLKSLMPKNARMSDFLALLQEGIRKDEDLRAAYIDRQKLAYETMTTLLKEGQDKHIIRQDMPAGYLAELLNLVLKGTLFEGAMLASETLEESLETQMGRLMTVMKTEVKDK